MFHSLHGIQVFPPYLADPDLSFRLIFYIPVNASPNSAFQRLPVLAHELPT